MVFRSLVFWLLLTLSLAVAFLVAWLQMGPVLVGDGGVLADSWGGLVLRLETLTGFDWSLKLLLWVGAGYILKVAGVYYAYRLFSRWRSGRRAARMTSTAASVSKQR